MTEIQGSEGTRNLDPAAYRLFYTISRALGRTSQLWVLKMPPKIPNFPIFTTLCKKNSLGLGSKNTKIDLYLLSKPTAYKIQIFKQTSTSSNPTPQDTGVPLCLMPGLDPGSSPGLPCISRPNLPLTSSFLRFQLFPSHFKLSHYKILCFPDEIFLFLLFF